MSPHHRPKRRPKKKAYKPKQFVAPDKYGNAVACTAQTWQMHVCTDHPEMAGRDPEVQDVLRDPDTIYPSTKTGSSLAFEGISSGGEIRVLVTYEDISLVTSGGTSGIMQTAYPVDRVTYNAPQIGAPIYQRPATTRAQAGESNQEEEEA